MPKWTYSTMEETSVPLETPKKRSRLGTILGTIVMIGVLILGALYVWGAKIEKERQERVEETLRMMSNRNVIVPPIEAPAATTSMSGTTSDLLLQENTSTKTQIN